MTETSQQVADDGTGRIGASPRLHMRVLSVLRRQISDGTLPEGTRLLESPLAAEFGVSRAPMRQALAALATQGLIRRAKGRGYLVERGGNATLATGDAAPGPEPILTARPSWQPIYDAVEKAIVERISLASWRLVEVDLARHFGVSRTLAREVTARLHQRGLVKRDDKGRWYAPALTADYISELYELRWTLEPLALVKAYEQAPRELVRRMHDNLESALARAASLTGRELDALEAELHIEFLGYGRNTTLLEALRLYQSLLIAHSFLYDASAAQFPSEPFLPEHGEILAALLAGDPAAASRDMALHLRAARDRAIARVDTIARVLTVSDLPYMHQLGR